MEPRYELEKESMCYGCPLYRHWTDSDDPEAFRDGDMDENGGVCDTIIPCFGGDLNTYAKK